MRDAKSEVFFEVALKWIKVARDKWDTLIDVEVAVDLKALSAFPRFTECSQLHSLEAHKRT